MNDSPVPNYYNSSEILNGQIASPQKEKPAYTKAELVISAAVAVIAFLYVRYAIFNIMGFITTAVFIAVITTVIVYLKNKGFTFSRVNIAIAAVLYIFSFVFSITANDLIKWLDLMFLFTAGAYLVYSVTAAKSDIERFLPFAFIKSIFVYPFSKFDSQGKIAADSVKGSKVGSNLKLVLLGLVVTVPLTAVVGALLMSADDGLEKLLTGIADRVFSEDIWILLAEIGLAVPCSMYLFGMIYANSFRSDIDEINDEECSRKLESARFIRNLVIYTAVTPICILYVMFFVSQASYFLSAFMNALPEGYSYADYARRGFFELFAVSLINMGVITGMSLHSKQGGREKPAALKFYTVMLSVFTLILIATAISKMLMYISVYGLTQLRVYTTWFMALMAIIFVMVIIKQFRFDFHFARHFSIAFTLMFALLCFARPDSLIAAYNIGMYNAGYLKELDTDAIMRMSDDAVLTAVNMGAVSDEEAADRAEGKYRRDSLSMYNISSLLLNRKISD